MGPKFEVCHGAIVKLLARAAVSSEGWAGGPTSRFSRVALGRPQDNLPLSSPVWFLVSSTRWTFFLLA